MAFAPMSESQQKATALHLVRVLEVRMTSKKMKAHGIYDFFTFHMTAVFEVADVDE